jgi:nucleoside-diphosphate-sugar epimerase
MQAHLFCFGLGYSARVLGLRLCAEGWRVSGTTRSPERATALRREGFDVQRFDGAHPLATAALEGATHVLISTPPQADGDPVLAALGEALVPLAQDWRWLGYLSTTGVYGDHGGGWVDETTPLTPQSDRARRRVEAERGWQDFAARSSAPLHIFRLPGIYGPGRSALDGVKAGTARRIDKPGQMFSRIHVEDLAEALRASTMNPHAGAIYNICDDEPAPQHEVVAYAAELLGVEPPPLEPFAEVAKAMSDMAQSFYGESKRVCNARIKRDLKLVLHYPSYREGLKAICAQA